MWLTDHLNTRVADLSHGQKRQLEIGMAVVTEDEDRRAVHDEADEEIASGLALPSLPIRKRSGSTT